jgi:hypothetical protein
MPVMATDRVFLARRKVDEQSAFGKTVFMVGYDRAVDILVHNLEASQKDTAKKALSDMLSNLYDSREDYNNFRDVVVKFRREYPDIAPTINKMIDTIYLS